MGVLELSEDVDVSVTGEEVSEGAPPLPVDSPSDDDGIEVEERKVEEVVAVGEVEEAVASQPEELDPRTLGVPGLKTLRTGDCIDVLWKCGEMERATNPRPCACHRPQAPHLTAPRPAGWRRGQVKGSVLELRAGTPVIIYRIAYDEGEKVHPAPRLPHPSPDLSAHLPWP